MQSKRENHQSDKGVSKLGRDPEWAPGGYPFRTLVEWELRQAKGEGRDPDALAQLEQESLTADDATLHDIWARILSLPVRWDYPFTEPDDLETIRELRPAVERRQFNVQSSQEWLFDHLYGAWLGRCAGCTLGGPAESLRPWTRQRLRKYLMAISPSEWPITDYLPGSSPADIKLGKPKATRERLDSVPPDDDLTHTVIGQIVLQNAEHPTRFETKDVARAWFQYVPYRVTAGGTAMLAYRNLVIRYPMGQISSAARDDGSIDWHWVATHSNPFREDIDAAIRADSYGYAAPGMPELAAELAWRDARLSNVKNGIYCSMFYAAMIAAAFALDDPVAIVQAGLAEIPVASRLHAAVNKVLEICKEHQLRSDRIEEVHEAIYETFGDDHNGTPNNMALVVSGFLLGGHDFEKVITYTVMGGWDSDSTAATAGSIAGAMLGAKRLEEKWTKPLNDTFYGQVIGYHPIAVSECARRSVSIARKVLEQD